MNNGYAGWKEFTSSFTFLHLDDTHDEWVLEKSLQSMRAMDGRSLSGCSKIGHDLQDANKEHEGQMPQ